LAGGGTASRTQSVTQLLRTILRRSHGAAVRIYDEAGNLIETHEHNGDFKEPWFNFLSRRAAASVV
jgi:hypothetical protein